MNDQASATAKQTYIGFALLSACVVFFEVVIYSQFYVKGPFGINPQGDFRAHSEFVDVYYSYIFIVRQFISDTFGISNYDSLFVIVLTVSSLNILIPAYLFWKPGKPLFAAALCAFIFCTFMPVYNLLDGGVYLGQISPNIWHNSTFLISIIPNLLFFLFAIKALEENLSSSNVVVLTLLAVFSFAAKPSYFAILAPSILLYTLLFDRTKFKKTLILGFVPCVLFVLFYMYFVPSDLDVTIDPGVVWSLFSNNILYSIFTSMIFFLVLFATYRKEILSRPDVIISLICLALGILQFYLLAETGPRRIHGNFSWGMHQAINVLLFVSLRFLLCHIRDKRTIIAGVALIPHVFSGLAYSAGKYIIPLLQYPTVPVFQ